MQRRETVFRKICEYRGTKGKFEHTICPYKKTRVVADHQMNLVILCSISTTHEEMNLLIIEQRSGAGERILRLLRKRDGLPRLARDNGEGSGWPVPSTPVILPIPPAASRASSTPSQQSCSQAFLIYRAEIAKRTPISAMTLQQPSTPRVE